MDGGFVLVVGPSGAGKDTLIGLAREALSGETRFAFPRRLVSRAASPFEDHDTLSPAAFEAGLAAGRFALAWRAHGLCYAIPVEARRQAQRGQVVVINVSRSVVEEARRDLGAVGVVEVTAPEYVLEARLHARRRATDGDVGERLARSVAVGLDRVDCTIVNDGSPEDGAARLTAFLRSFAKNGRNTIE